MKTIIIIIAIISTLSLPSIMAQDQEAGDTLKLPEFDTVQLAEEEITPDTSHTEKPTVIEKGDTTYVILGKKKIKIVEKGDETSVNIEEEGKEEEEFVEKKRSFSIEDDDEIDFSEPAWKRFKGSWAGFEFGLNNYLNGNYQFGLTDEADFMELNTWRSWNLNLNFAQYSMGFGCDFAGVVVGMGIEWNNYHFADDNSIIKENGNIVEGSVPDNTTYTRLQSTYFTAPILLEIQTRNPDDRAYFSVGVIGGVRIFSNTKVKYVEDGDKKKIKNKNDYYLSPIRYGLTARAGYDSVGFYFNYYPTPLFQPGNGPELYPIAIGLVVLFE